MILPLSRKTMSTRVFIRYGLPSSSCMKTLGPWSGESNYLQGGTCVTQQDETNRSTQANLVTTTASIIGNAYTANADGPIVSSSTLPRTRAFEQLSGKHTAFSLNNVQTSILRVFVIIDPVSEQAQKWSAIIEVRVVLAFSRCS